MQSIRFSYVVNMLWHRYPNWIIWCCVLCVLWDIYVLMGLIHDVCTIIDVIIYWTNIITGSSKIDRFERHLTGFDLNCPIPTIICENLYRMEQKKRSFFVCDREQCYNWKQTMMGKKEAKKKTLQMTRRMVTTKSRMKPYISNRRGIKASCTINYGWALKLSKR